MTGSRAVDRSGPEHPAETLDAAEDDAATT